MPVFNLIAFMKATCEQIRFRSLLTPASFGKLARFFSPVVLAIACAQTPVRSEIEFGASTDYPLSTGTGADATLGDLDGDGDLDVVVAVTAGFSRIWVNQGLAQGGTPGTFAEAGQELGTGSARAVALADLDADDDQDIFFLEHSPTGPYFHIWINQGGTQAGTRGTFLHKPQLTGDHSGSALALGALDGDVSPDAFIVRSGSFPDTVWFNNAEGEFTSSGQALGDENGMAVALGDVDGDSDLDAWVGLQFGNRLWLNQAGRQGGTPGSFEDSGQNLDGDPFSSTGVAIGDLDGDGDLDAFLAKAIVGEIWLNQAGLQGGAQGMFLRSSQNLGPNDNAISRKIALGDFDGDADLDAFVARFGPALVLENDGAGNFTRTQQRLGGLANRNLSLALGDLDNDGDLDALAVNSDRVFRIWFNETPPPFPSYPEYIISTIAGTGTSGFSGDGGPANQAQLDHPSDLAVDSLGNLYIVDTDNQRVRKVAPDGTISTFAGTGTRGFSGDGGPAALAQFDIPTGVAVDRDDNIYIVDSYNDCIRKIDQNGVITTIAGHPDNLQLPPGYGDGGPATMAEFNSASDIIIDPSGNIYVIDSERIRKIDTNGIIHHFAGKGMAFNGEGGPATETGLGEPRSIATRGGELFIDAPEYHKIRKVDASGIITTIAGRVPGDVPAPLFNGYGGNGGPAIDALLENPGGIAFDPAGNLYFADRDNHRLRRIDTNGIISTVAGNGEITGPFNDGIPARDAVLSFFGSEIATTIDHQGNVFFLDNGRVRKLTPTGKHLPVTPNFFSNPRAGHVFDSGTWPPHAPQRHSVRIGNDGVADLRIESIALIDIPRFITARLGALEDLPTFPHVVPDGYHSDLVLELVITINSEVPALIGGKLRITTNDPETPIIDYPLIGAFSDTSLTNLEQTAVELQIDELSSQSAPSLKSRASRTALRPANGPRTVALQLDTNAARQVATEIPAFLGGGSVVLSNFSGSVIITATPLPNDSGQFALSIDGGSFTAPSFTLPSGLQSGPNTLTFGPASQSGGMLIASNGQYTAYAWATIRNGLFPQGFPVRGTYTGTFNQATGKITVQSTSTDLFEKSAQLQWTHSAGQILVTWSLDALLEGATNILGPWLPLTNGPSPYAIPTTSLPKEFFRLNLQNP